MIKLEGNNIRITRGDSFTINLSIFEEDGETPYTPSLSDIIYFTVKPDVNNVYSVIKKTFSNGSIVMEKSDTINLNFGEYFYDIRLESSSNIDTILDQGTFIIEGGTANASS